MTTDTITREVVATTITDLTTARDRARQRLVDEEALFVAKRDRMVLVAHEKATTNSIGGALDDLCAEFGLPRRGPTGYLYAVLRITAALQEDTDRLTLASGSNVYRGETPFLVTYHYEITQRASATEGSTCICEEAERFARAWLRDHYGSRIPAGATFQIGQHNCDVSECIQRADGTRYAGVSMSTAAETPWHTLPTYTITQQEATTS